MYADSMSGAQGHQQPLIPTTRATSSGRNSLHPPCFAVANLEPPDLKSTAFKSTEYEAPKLVGPDSILELDILVSSQLTLPGGHLARRRLCTHAPPWTWDMSASTRTGQLA